MDFIKEEALSFDDICLVPVYSDMLSRSEADISYKSNRNPIANSPMIHTSNVNMLRFMQDNNMITTVHRYFKSEIEQLYHVTMSLGIDYINVFFSVGKNTKWIDYLYHNGVRRFLVDMAHGDSLICCQTIEYIRSLDDVEIIAGNVTTKSGYKRLRYAGADHIRVSIASGSICSTAKNTAFGVPIVTSLLECNEAKKETGGSIIADGGIRGPADILKAIACGSDFVFCGKLLAGTSQSRGPFLNKKKRIITNSIFQFNKEPFYAEYAGMASNYARSINNTHQVRGISEEGEAGIIKYTGDTSDVIDAIEGNLRGGMSYCGSRTWSDFKENVIIRKMSTAGYVEKMTHLDGSL